MNKPIRFITFEGGEGAGKTTLIDKIRDELTKQGLPVIATREPGGSLLGDQIRQWLLNGTVKPDAKAELLLFLAARRQHVVELIRPAILAGKIVLCDRFNDSTVAYQGYARGLGAEQIQELCHFATDQLEPDLTFFLDLDPQEGLKRTKGAAKENAQSGQLDRIESEKIEFHQKVRDGMQQLAKQYPQRIVTLNAHLSPQQVYQQAIQKLDSLSHV